MKFILLVRVIVGIFKFMNRINDLFGDLNRNYSLVLAISVFMSNLNFMLSRVFEEEKTRFITGLGSIRTKILSSKPKMGNNLKYQINILRQVN